MFFEVVVAELMDTSAENKVLHFFIFHVAYLGNSCPIHVPQPSRQLLLRFPLRLQMLLQPSLSPHRVTLLLVGPRPKGVLGRDDEFGRGERADKDDAAVRF